MKFLGFVSKRFCEGETTKVNGRTGYREIWYAWKWKYGRMYGYIEEVLITFYY